MATIKKSGGWDSSYGGRDFSGKGGKVQFTGRENGNGVPSASKPTVEEGKKGQVNFLGAGGNKGMVSKPKGGSGGGKSTSSGWAATHD